jgi:hypothetical protein
VSPISEDDADQIGKKARSKGTLPYLPNRDAPLSEHRAWIDRALAAPSGYRLESFVRHGRQLSNPAEMTLLTPVGGHVKFRFREQRGLARPNNLRATLYSVTDGLCRPPHLTNGEASDVWCALCAFAYVGIQQDERDETSDWLDKFLEIAKVETEHTLEPDGRYDALVALQERGMFERQDAQALLAPPSKAWSWMQPVVLRDSKTRRDWIRVKELATYVRNVVGVPLGYGVLDGRMLELGAERYRYEARNGKAHPCVNFYLLPLDEPV